MTPWMIEGAGGAGFAACCVEHAHLIAIELETLAIPRPAAIQARRQWCARCAWCGRIVAPAGPDPCLLHGARCPTTARLETIVAASLAIELGRPWTQAEEGALLLLLDVLDDPAGVSPEHLLGFVLRAAGTT